MPPPSPSCAAWCRAGSGCAWRPSTDRASPYTMEAEGFLARVIQHDVRPTSKAACTWTGWRGCVSLSFLREF